jgi:hypothetical protein
MKKITDISIIGIIFSISFLYLYTFSLSYAGIPEPGIILYGKVLDNTGKLLTTGELNITYATGDTSIQNRTQLNLIQGDNEQYSYSILIPIETQLPGYPISENAISISQTPILYTRTAQIENTTIIMTDTVTVFKEDIGTAQQLLISKSGDTDNDGLPDAWEQQIINANSSDSITTILHVNPLDDFDNDGFNNINEYLNQTDPTLANIPEPGDINCDGSITIVDAVIVLDIISEKGSTGNRINLKADVNANETLGIEEVNYILMKVAGLR